MRRKGPYSKKSYLFDMISLFTFALIFWGLNIREYRQQYLLKTRGITTELENIYG